MSQENVDLVRRMFEEFGWSPSGIEKASQAGVVAPDITDGVVSRWKGYADRSEVLEAPGLRD